jgi:hypothetical protein
LPDLIRSAAVLFPALFVAGTVEAKVVTYTCKFGSNMRLLPADVRIDFNAETEGVLVTYRVSRDRMGAPVPGRHHATAKRQTFRWAVEMSNAAGQRTRMDCAVTFCSSGRKPTLRAKPFGYVSDFGVDGKCAKKQG